jgi:hypothetical protein
MTPATVATGTGRLNPILAFAMYATLTTVMNAAGMVAKEQKHLEPFG